MPKGVYKHYSHQFFKKGNSLAKGTKRSIETRKKLSIAKLENKNPMWKGNNVGYASLHEWIKNRLPKPDTCEICHAVEPYDLSNRSNKYLRDLSDWEWLCRKCHMIKDGRLKKLKRGIKGAKNNK